VFNLGAAMLIGAVVVVRLMTLIMLVSPEGPASRLCVIVAPRTTRGVADAGSRRIV
jgi:hypothetical protein